MKIKQNFVDLVISLANITVIVILSAILAGCISDSNSDNGASNPSTNNGDPNKVPEEIINAPALCQNADTTDDQHFDVLYPNGGQEFCIGDTVTFYACSEDLLFNSLTDAQKTISLDGGNTWSEITYTTNEKGNEVYWAIPDSLDFPSFGAIEYQSTVSDSVVYRVSIYIGIADPLSDYDESEEFFSIKKCNN